MKIKISGAIFLALFLLVLTSACTNNGPAIPSGLQKSFNTMFPIEDINKSVRLSISSLYHDRTIGSTVYLTLSNQSDNQIRFPVALGLRIFIIEKGVWVEVQNQVSMYGNELVLEPKTDVLMSQAEIDFDPKIIDNGKSIQLRAVVIGEKVVNGQKTGIPVAAYIDLTLKP
jgi:hypothetical protein